MAYPILAPQNGWYKSTAARTTITEIHFVDNAITTYDETWNCDVNNTGTIKGYRVGTVIYVSGLGAGKIAANADSSYMFASSSQLYSKLTKITNLAYVDTSNVTNMWKMFDRATSLSELDVSSWNTSNVTNMSQVFQGCLSLTSLDLSRWDVSKVTTMRQLVFSNASLGEMSITSIGDVSNWDTSNVTDMGSAFAYCSSLRTVNVTNWDTSKVTTFNNMFYKCSSLTELDVSKWNTSSATNMSQMFYECSSLTRLNTSNWNVSKVTTMAAMFRYCFSLEELDVSKWDVSSVTSFKHMFSSRDSDNGIIKMKFKELDVSNWNTSSVTDMSFMFWGCQCSLFIDVSKWNVSNVVTFDHMFANSKLTIGDTSNWKVSTNCTNLNALFHSLLNTTIDVSNFDTRNVTCFGQMFDQCYELENIIGLENFDTSASLDFSDMFYDCKKLKELNLSSFDTTKAKDGEVCSANGSLTETMRSMFLGTFALEKITLGPNFSFNGDGTTTIDTNIAVLLSPSSEYIDGADGYWYTAEGHRFAAEEIPSRVAATYYAKFPSKIVKVNYTTMTELADVIRDFSKTDSRYTFGDMVAFLKDMPKIPDAEKEVWTFVLEDGSNVEKDVYINTLE